MRGTVLAVLVGAAGAAAAQPANPPDYARAADLYKAAEAEAAGGKLDDAIRDYAAAYDITKDPVLFYKIGVANQRDNKCEVALVYFGRYLREGKPAERFVDVTSRRIEACGGDPAKLAAPLTAPKPPVAGDTAAPPAKPLPPAHGTTAAWLMVGGGVAFVITGAVLAYSAKSSEKDIDDLYAGLDGVAPQFTPATAQRYQQLVDEGHRYEYLSWASFGVAAGFAAVATWMFIHHPRESLQVAPVVTPKAAGVTAAWSF
jgi:hypothetical protein